MKIALGLPALLLGTTLFVGAAFAAPAPNPNPPPPPPPFTGPHHPGHAGPPPGASGQPHWNHALNFHDRNVAHFSAQDRAMWTQGQWRHTRHNGHDGWWWYTGGAWFFYNQPVYPYPAYASDDYYLDDETGDVTPDQRGYSWYYCNNPPGYYPYVQSCRGPWQPVAPTAPPGYDNQAPQNGPGADEGDDRGAPPPGWQQGRDDYRGQQGPQQGYDNGDDNDDDDQGPPPPGYNNNDRGPPPGYSDEPPPPPHP